MAVASRGRLTDLQIPKLWKERDTSPERTKVWTEPKLRSDRKVPVVYYLARNGHLEHPHFMEVPLSSSEGLYLRDVINRLNVLRGKGMATMYSWSSKRSYKNGFVWHDLSENDFIYPLHGKEYVLKGSELLYSSSLDNQVQASASSRSLKPPEMHKLGEESDFPISSRRRNQSWSAVDFHEYKVYKTDSSSDSSAKAAADASTQTDEKRRRRRPVREEEKEGKETEELHGETSQQELNRTPSTELSREEISPPPSDSSPETLESLMKADGRLIISESANVDHSNRTTESFPSGRMKASAVLMQLISCGSMSFKDCGATSMEDQELSIVGPCKSSRLRLPRDGENRVGKEAAGTPTEIEGFSGIRLEDKEYFSGSLIETQKVKEAPALKRSSSYNADRGSQLQLSEKEIDGVRAKCMPRKHKAAQTTTKKETYATDGPSITACNSQHGSKRLEAEQQ